MAIVLGVSSPSGMAVTSDRPVRRAMARAMTEEHQVAEQHADSRTGDHVLQGKRCRKVKDPGQQTDREQQIGDVV